MNVPRVSVVWMLTLTTLFATEASAQAMEGAEAQGWSVTLFGEGGVYYSTRDLGKATVDSPENQRVQMRSELITSPVLAVGAEIQSPWEALRLRVLGRTTIGGGARGQLGACSVLPEEPDACVEVDTEGSVRSAQVGVMFISQAAERRMRAYLTLDAGLRFFSFDDASCAASTAGDAAWANAICSGQDVVTEDQTRILVEAGLGVRYDFGAADAYLELLDSFGGYEVTTREDFQAEGETQNAIMLVAGVALPIG